MRASRRATRALGAVAAAAMAAAVLATSTALTGSAAAATYHDSAYGIALKSAIPGLAIPPTPHVSSPSGKPKSASAGEIALPPSPAPPAVTVRVLKVAARKFHADASVAELQVAGGNPLPAALNRMADQAPPQLGDLIRRVSDQLAKSGTGTGFGARVISAVCDRGQGAVSIIGGSGQLSAVNGPVPANTQIPPAPPNGVSLPPSPLTITLNKQVRNADGSLTVTALEVLLRAQGTTVLKLDVASATCDAPPTYHRPPPPAPTPSPVPTQVAVTG